MKCKECGKEIPKIDQDYNPSACIDCEFPISKGFVVIF